MFAALTARRLDPLAHGKLALGIKAFPLQKDGPISLPHRQVREHLLAALLKSPEDAILSVFLDGTIDTWSQGAKRVYGYTAKEMTGQPIRRLVPPREWPRLKKILSHAASNGSAGSETTERLHKDGSQKFLRVERVFIRDEQGNITGFLERARTLNSFGVGPSAEAPVRSTIEQMPGLHWTTDKKLRITSCWGKGLASSEIPPASLLGRSVCEFLGCADPDTAPTAEHYEALRGCSSHFEYHWKNRYWEICVEPLRAATGQIIGCLGSGLDITDRKKNEEQAYHQARHDALTGLANYRELMDRLVQEVHRAERSHHAFTVLLLDLDGLKRINDLHGHLAGNRALQRLAVVMNEHCRSTDLAVRYGGDEFALVMIDSDRAWPSRSPTASGTACKPIGASRPCASPWSNESGRGPLNSSPPVPTCAREGRPGGFCFQIRAERDIHGDARGREWERTEIPNLGILGIGELHHA